MFQYIYIHTVACLGILLVMSITFMRVKHNKKHAFTNMNVYTHKGAYLGL